MSASERAAVVDVRFASGVAVDGGAQGFALGGGSGSLSLESGAASSAARTR